MISQFNMTYKLRVNLGARRIAKSTHTGSMLDELDKCNDE